MVLCGAAFRVSARCLSEHHCLDGAHLRYCLRGVAQVVLCVPRVLQQYSIVRRLSDVRDRYVIGMTCESSSLFFFRMTPDRTGTPLPN